MCATSIKDNENNAHESKGRLVIHVCCYGPDHNLLYDTRLANSAEHSYSRLWQMKIDENPTLDC